MALPPGVTQANFDRALREFEGASARTGSSRATPTSICTATRTRRTGASPRRRSRRRPSRRRASRKCRRSSASRTATEIPLYPISTGKNLGYGGSAPVLRQRRARFETHEPRARGQREAGVLRRRARGQLLRSVPHISGAQDQALARRAGPRLGQRHGQRARSRRRLHELPVPQPLRRALRHGSRARERRGRAHGHGRACRMPRRGCVQVGLRPVRRRHLQPVELRRRDEDGLLAHARARSVSARHHRRAALRGSDAARRDHDSPREHEVFSGYPDLGSPLLGGSSRRSAELRDCCEYGALPRSSSRTRRSRQPVWSWASRSTGPKTSVRSGSTRREVPQSDSGLDVRGARVLQAAVRSESKSTAKARAPESHPASSAFRTCARSRSARARR